MKKIFTSVFLICTFAVGIKAQSKDPSQYFNDATHLAQFKKELQVLTLSGSPYGTWTFTFTGTPPVIAVAQTANFNALYAQIINQHEHIVSLSAPVAGVMGPGPMSAVSTPVAAWSGADEMAMKEELALALFILYGNPNQFVLANFPSSAKKEFKYLPQIVEALAGADNFRSNSSAELQASLGSFIPGLDNLESQIIYGITNFAIKRAKEELMEAHLNYWYEQLNADPIVKSFLPNTLSVYLQFKEDNSLSLAKYGDIWKAAFQEDLRNMPVKMQDEALVKSMINVVIPSQPGAVIPSKTFLEEQMVPIICGGNKLAYDIYLKKHPVAAIRELSELYMQHAPASTPDVSYFKRGIVATDLLTSLSGNFDKGVYTPADINAVRRLTGDEWVHFVRLLMVRNIEPLKVILPGNVIDGIVTNATTHIPFLKTQITGGINNIMAVQSIISTVQSRTGDSEKITFEEVHKVFDITFTVVDSTFSFVEHFSPGTISANTQRDYYNIVHPAVKSITQMAEGITTKQYGKVLNGVTGVLNILKYSVNKDTESTIAPTINKITRYGSFMVNVLSAKDDKDVAAALNEMIPRGQYKLKNATVFSASLSLYPGGFIGGEMIYKFKKENGVLDQSTKHANVKGSAAFYLPIGVDLNFGIKKRNTNIGVSSFNIFIHPIDLGAVLNYRLTSSSSEEEKPDPKLGFKQLLSPGADFLFHLPKSPVVLGFGINYTPDLREIKQTDDTGATASLTSNALRFGLCLAVDVTTIHIGLTKKKKNILGLEQ